MPNYSHLTIAGHLGRDASLKDTSSGSVLEFSIAVTHKQKGGDSTAWYNCALWGKRGESLAQYLTKGTAMIVGGDFVPREYDGKDGGKRTSLDLKVQSITFAGGGSERKQDSAASESAPPPPVDDEEPLF